MNKASKHSRSAANTLVDTQLLDKTTDTSHNMPVRGDYLFITITVSDDSQYVHNNYETRKDKFICNTKLMFKRYLRGYEEYKFALELTLNGRLHWHGYIKINNPEHVLNSIFTMERLHHLTQIKPTYNNNGIHFDVQKMYKFDETYMLKDNETMKTIITNNTKCTINDLKYLEKEDTDHDITTLLDL